MASPSTTSRMAHTISRNLTRLNRQQVSPKLIITSRHLQPITSGQALSITSRHIQHSRALSFSTTFRKGIQPDTEEPAPKESEPIHHLQDPTPISDADFHDRAEALLEEISAKIEDMQETREDVDAEYSAGVLNITFPPIGTYVLNKQPPNKQIWLSSPITGPKRFDWVVKGEDMGSKEGGASGDWIYLRDGTSLIALLRKELGITVGQEDGSIE